MRVANKELQASRVLIGFLLLVVGSQLIPVLTLTDDPRDELPR
jgi:hypothetical protein